MLAIAGLGLSALSQLMKGPGIAEAMQNSRRDLEGQIRDAQLQGELAVKQWSFDDISSPYNRSILSLFMKQAQSLAPSQDTFASGLRGAEGMSYGTGGLLGMMRAKDAQRKATDMANDQFTRFYANNQTQSNNLLQMRLNQQDSIMNRYQRQQQYDRAQSNDTRDFWASMGNELINFSGIGGSGNSGPQFGETADEAWNNWSGW